MARIKVPDLIDIVAIGKNSEMGYQGGLPWSGMTKDIRKFVERTLDNGIVLMGDTTFLSIPKERRPLHNRDHYVLSFNPENPELQRYSGQISICGSIPEAFAKIDKNYPKLDSPVINVGGGKVFETCMPYTSGIFLTTLDIRPDADTYFEFDRREWKREGEIDSWVEENAKVNGVCFDKVDCVDEFLVRRKVVPKYIEM